MFAEGTSAPTTAPRLFVPMRGTPAAATAAPAIPQSPNRHNSPTMPRPIPAQIAAGRGAPVRAPQMPAQDAGAMAYAMDKFKEAGNPWTAAAQGLINAQQYREGQDLDESKRAEAGKLLADHPDLQDAVSKGVIELPAAADMAAKRDALKTANARKQSILEYLTQSGDDDIAQQYANGVLDEDGVAAAVRAKDEAAAKTTSSTPTEDQKELAQINTERKAAGKPELTLEEYKAQNKPVSSKGEFTVSQSAAAGYADRMAQSNAVLSGEGMDAIMTDMWEQRGSLPLVGDHVASSEWQQADQAKRDFINAILRRESGAVISDKEFDNANQQYFPVPGNDEAVLKQKAANRRNAIAGIARQAGPNYETPDTTNYLNEPPDGVSEPGGLPNPLDSASGELPADDAEIADQEYPEGTVIQNDEGVTMTMTNGEWV